MNWLMLIISLMILGILAFVFAIRYFIHLERIALIKQGIIPPALMNPVFNRGSFGMLLAGLITAFSGLGLLIGFYLGLGKGFWLIGGFLPIGVGSALILGYFMGSPNRKTEVYSVQTQTDNLGKEVEDKGAAP
jgi:hypothetical protein